MISMNKSNNENLSSGMKWEKKGSRHDSENEINKENPN